MSDPKKYPDDVVKDPLGKEGVTESPDDLPADEETYHEVRDSDDPARVPTPTAPDDARNTLREQTTNMNDHIPQGVPPDF